MLDNLKLGYGGTKEEMQRLLEDATALSGVEYDISSYADIVDAIHVVQTEMGITGTTAEEASSTIQGSISSMSAAWTNFLTGMADPEQDFDALLNNLIDSVMTVADNLVPRIIETVPRLVEGVSQLITTLAGYLPDMLQELLPAILNGVMALMQSITDSLPAIMEVILTMIPMIVAGITELLPQIIEVGLQIIIALAEGLAESLPELIPAIVDCVILIVETLIDNIDLLIDAAIELIVALADGLIEALPKLIEKVPDIIVKLQEAFVRNAGKLAYAAGQLIVTLATALIKNIPNLVAKIPTIITAVLNAFTSGFRTIATVGMNLIMGLWNGISDKVGWIKDKIVGFGETVMSTIKGIFGIHSPSKKFKWVGEMCVEGFEEPLEEYNPYDTLEKSMQANANTLKANYLAGDIGTGTGTTTQTVNIYQPVKTPSETARALRIEQQYGLAGA